MAQQVKTSSREARRVQTRERILGAAIAEFKRSGLAGADVADIVAAAGVAHGTFYFHFPTKEHILLEVESREEARVAVALTRFLDQSPDLAATLSEVVRLIIELEQRVGRMLFKELLAYHFSAARPNADEWSDHRVIVLLVSEIERARGHGQVHQEVDAFYSAVFFLLGIYGVLCATDSFEARNATAAKLVRSTVRGLA